MTRSVSLTHGKTIRSMFPCSAEQARDSNAISATDSVHLLPWLIILLNHHFAQEHSNPNHRCCATTELRVRVVAAVVLRGQPLSNVAFSHCGDARGCSAA